MNNYKTAYSHLQIDPIMNFLIKKFGSEIDLYDRYEEDYAKALANLIIEQQVSFKAAITIKKRLKKLIENKTHTEIINIDDDEIKSIGISFRKVEYIKNVYSFFNLNKNIDFKNLETEEIKAKLISIKGIGKWTIEMFLIFVLHEENIFSKGDLALINSMKKNYIIENVTDEIIDSIVNKWSPFKTIASLLLWKSIEEKVFYNADL